MKFFAVFCLSASSLLYELFLTRYFSIAHWNHLSFMVIGIAMLGYGASGAVFALARAARPRQWAGVFPIVSLACAASVLGSFLSLRLIPLDYLRLPVEPVQLCYLLLTELVLSIPFFFAGLGSCLAYVGLPERSGLVAFASMVGSGAGSLAPIFLFPSLGAGGLVASATLTPIVAALILSLPRDQKPRTSSRFLLGCAAFLAVALVAVLVWQWNISLSIQPSPYKALPQLQQSIGSRVTSRWTSVWGSFAEVQSPSLHYAPGLSLSFSASLPSQSAIALDGDDLTILTNFSGREEASFARWTHSFAGYILANHPASSLVIQRGGGIGIACSVASGAKQISVVVEQPDIARALRAHYGSLGIVVEAENPRSFLARPGRSFDTIQVDDWGPSIPGMASLNQEALFTVEAFRAYWRRLNETGVIIVSRRLILPPSDSLRLFATALTAVRQEGVLDGQEHLAVIRNWDTYSLLISRRPVQGLILDSLTQFANTMSFDLDWFPGITAEETNRFNRIPGSLFFKEYAELVKNALYTATYSLDVAPQSDERPFPNRFIRLSRIGDFLRSVGGRTSTLLLSGEIVVVAVLLEAIILSVALLVPSALSLHGGKAGRPAGRIVLVFAASGMGYLLTEIAFLNAFALLFSNPFVTLSIVLGGLLIFSGIGGLISERLPRHLLAPTLVLIPAVLVLLLWALPRGLPLLLPLALPDRTAASIGLLLIPSVLLGIPFPLAMRFEATTDRERAYAWAANGCASVIAS
ncbi:MAG: hypothetical protein ABSG21_11720, partial [Spirochaetia bacterium]